MRHFLIIMVCAKLKEAEDSPRVLQLSCQWFVWKVESGRVNDLLAFPLVEYKKRRKLHTFGTFSTHSHAIILFHPPPFSLLLPPFTVGLILAAYLVVIDDASMVPILRGHVPSTCCPFRVDFCRITAFSIRWYPIFLSKEWPAVFSNKIRW